MTALHELYLSVKQEVAEAVAAVNAATDAAAQIAHDAIQEALAAVYALDDYLDYFGWVGDPIDAAVEAFLEQLYNLAKVLDDRGYYAVYNRTFGAANQYANAKKSYDGFTGGHGGTSSGGGASSDWFGKDAPYFPIYACFNRNGAKLNSLGACAAPLESQVDYTVLLGACSDVFIYEEDCPEWDAGIYQFIRRKVLLWFWDKEGWVSGDYGETPKYLAGLPYNYNVTADNSATEIFELGGLTDWGEAGPINYWPIDTAWPIYDGSESYHDKTTTVVGRYEYNGHLYWLYNESYWFAVHQHVLDGQGQPINAGNPDQLRFTKICETPTPGKDITPKPIPIPIPIPFFIDDKIRANLMNTLRLGVDVRPYEIMISRQKLTLDGEQLTIGDT